MKFCWIYKYLSALPLNFLLIKYQHLSVISMIEVILSLKKKNIKGIYIHQNKTHNIVKIILRIGKEWSKQHLE